MAYMSEDEKLKLREGRRVLETALRHFEDETLRLRDELTEVKHKKLHLEHLCNRPIEELGFGVEAEDILNEMHVKTLGDLTLLTKDDLSKYDAQNPYSYFALSEQFYLIFKRIERTLGPIGFKMKESKEKEPCKK